METPQLSDVKPKNSVDDYAWEELALISEALANADSEIEVMAIATAYHLCAPDGHLNEGKAKTLTLADGTETAAQIIGFAHDKKETGERVGITFLLKDAIGLQPMNREKTSVGGWEASRLNEWLRTEGTSYFPEEVVCLLTPVRKKINRADGDKGAFVTGNTIASLWLPSMVELCGTCNTRYREHAHNEIMDFEGYQYQLFEETGVEFRGSNRILAKTFGGKSCMWWLRSPDPGADGSFYCVGHVGGPDIYNLATAVHGVVPGFCI